MTTMQRILTRAPRLTRAYATPTLDYHQTVKKERASPTNGDAKAISRASERPKWSELNVKGKVKRSTVNTSNFGVIVFGLGIFSAIAYLLSEELLFPDSSTKAFSQALDKISQHEECITALGTSIKGYGEASSNRMARNRRVASQLVPDPSGKQHLIMRFNVEGQKGKGIAYLDMVKEDSDSSWDYSYLIVDIPSPGSLSGSKRINVVYKDKGLAGTGVTLRRR